MNRTGSLGLEDESRYGEGLIVGRRGYVTLVMFDRPEVGNAYNDEMKASLGRLWRELDDDRDTRCIVLASSSMAHFSTGRDLKEVASSGSVNRDLPFERAVGLTTRHAKVWTPVIAAVEGKTVGGGLHFIVDADIVVASSSATFMDTHVNVGFVGAVENVGLAMKAGLGASLYMTLLGRQAVLSAERAYQLGLVQELVPEGMALDRAMQIADIVCANSPSAVSRSLEAIWSLPDLGYENAIRYGWLLVRRQWDHPDSTEGPTAFAEKREPRWVD